METWNYRVIEFTTGVPWKCICEVYYKGGKPVARTTPISVVWDMEEDDEEAFAQLERMREALTKPALKDEDFV